MVDHRPSRWVLGGIGGMLAALVLVAPVVATVAACMLATLALIAWTVLTPRTPEHTYTLTPRRVIALVRHLPHDSATVAALRGGPQFRGWTADRYLLTLHGDLLQRLIWIQAAKANPKRKPPQPKPLPRPDTDRPANERSERNLFRDTALSHLRNARNAREVGTRGDHR